jgi:hypothetical protein
MLQISVVNSDGTKLVITDIKNIKSIKSKRVKWVEHVACMGDIRNGCKILKSEGKKHSEKKIKNIKPN